MLPEAQLRARWKIFIFTNRNKIFCYSLCNNNSVKRITMMVGKGA